MINYHELSTWRQSIQTKAQILTSLVFLHGATTDPQEWHRQLHALKSEFDCHAPNLTSFDSIDAMADNVLQQAPPLFTLCGTSMGGYVALTVMRKSPNRVEGLILLNTSAREDTLQRKSERLASIEKTEDAFTEERRSNNYYASLLSPYHDGDATLLKEASENACRAGFASFIRHQKACMNRISALDLLPDIKIPTLIVAGRDDLLIPLECQVELAARIPNSEFMIIEQCGHVAHLEHAETLNSRIAKFVKERVMRQQ